MSSIKEKVEQIVRQGFPKAGPTLIKEGGKFRIRGFDHENRIVKVQANFPRPCRHPDEYSEEFGERMEGLMVEWDEAFNKNVEQPIGALGYTVEMEG